MCRTIRGARCVTGAAVVLLAGLFGSIAGGGFDRAFSADDKPELFRVAEPAPGERFAAVQGAHAKREARNKLTPDYLRAAGMFLDRCSSCHGEYGWGDGPWHSEFHPEPANLTLVNDAPQMARSIILNGIPNTMMPAFPDLDNQAIDGLLDFVAMQPRDVSNQWDHPWELAKQLGENLQKPDLQAGHQQFVSACTGCHGGGEGEGIMTRSPHLWPRPANLKARSSDIGRLYFIITHGREGTFMAPQEDKLPQLARWRAAQYVQSLYDINSQAVMRHPQGEIPVVTNPFSRADADAADQGRIRYDLWCAPCHASGARGSFLAPRLIDRKWKYADGTDTAVWTVVKEGVPGKLMVSFEKVNEEERWKIITFLRYMGGLPDPVALAGQALRRRQEGR